MEGEVGGKGRRGLNKTLFHYLVDKSGHGFHTLDICDAVKSKVL